jgi:hypothetical protein
MCCHEASYLRSPYHSTSLNKIGFVHSFYHEITENDRGGLPLSLFFSDVYGVFFDEDDVAA